MTARDYSNHKVNTVDLTWLPRTTVDGKDACHAHAIYLSPIFKDRADRVQAFVNTMRNDDVGVDLLVGTGMSGALMVPAMADAIGTRFAIVRKVEEQSTHSSSPVEGTLVDGDRWLFVDDLISSGDTLRYVQYVVPRIYERLGYKQVAVGQYLYYAGGSQAGFCRWR